MKKEYIHEKILSMYTRNKDLERPEKYCKFNVLKSFSDVIIL